MNEQPLRETLRKITALSRRETDRIGISPARRLIVFRLFTSDSTKRALPEELNSRKTAD
jgi:hypothetical protein